MEKMGKCSVNAVYVKNGEMQCKYSIWKKWEKCNKNVGKEII